MINGIYETKHYCSEWDFDGDGFNKGCSMRLDVILIEDEGRWFLKHDGGSTHAFTYDQAFWLRDKLALMLADIDKKRAEKDDALFSALYDVSETD